MSATIDKQVWDYLLNRIGNEYGVAGLMGNLRAESGILPFRKQGDFTSGYTASWTYTNNVNSGSISESTFVNDAVGYGLAQWTFSTRKQNLYNRTVALGYYVNNLRLQLDFLIWELENDYSGVLTVLENATSIRVASDKVLHDFENPREQGTSVEEYRASLGQTIYDTYHGSEPEPEPPEPPTPSELNTRFIILTASILEDI